MSKNRIYLVNRFTICNELAAICASMRSDNEQGPFNKVSFTIVKGTSKRALSYGDK